jgi:hypothetical protein
VIYIRETLNKTARAFLIEERFTECVTKNHVVSTQPRR